jgi:hypothetical protein
MFVKERGNGKGGNIHYSFLDIFLAFIADTKNYVSGIRFNHYVKAATKYKVFVFRVMATWLIINNLPQHNTPKSTTKQ